MDLHEFFLKQKQAVHHGTVEVVAKVPHDQLAWRPGEKMLSLGELLRHIWTSEEGILAAALDGDWSYYETRVPEGLGAIFSKFGPIEKFEEELAKIERAHNNTMSKVRSLPARRWDEARENPSFKIRRSVAVMLFGINEHEMHHRAQLGTYIRILTGHRASPYAL